MTRTRRAVLVDVGSARSARRLRRIPIVFYTTTTTITALLSRRPYQRDDEDTRRMLNGDGARKWIERVEFAGFDAWE